MLQFVIAGLVLGGIYAISSAGLVITYTASGILNFAFGAIAFFIARFYYFLNTQHSWSILPAAVLSIGVAPPALGVLLYVVLFRHLRLSSPMIKVVATIGLLVAIPSLATLIFGNQAINQAPGLAPQPVAVYQFLGVPVTLDQVIVYICVVVTVVAGAVILRYPDVGLKVRAMVDSPAMTDLSGTNPTAVSVGVWAVSTLFAGLCGVLAAPIIGLDPDNFTLLIAASFAAVVAAKLRNLPVAVVVGLLLGVAHSPHAADRGLVRRPRGGKAAESAGGRGRGATDGCGHLAHPALPAVRQRVDHRSHRRRALHRRGAVPALQPVRPVAGRCGRRLGRPLGPRYHAAGREPPGRFDDQRGRDGLAQLRRQVRRPPPAHHHCGGATRHRVGLLGGLVRAGLRLRRHLPVLDHRDR